MNRKKKLTLSVLFSITMGMLLPFVMLGPLHAREADSFIIQAKPRDIWPPAPVTDLRAESTAAEGRIKLSWTAPTENLGLPSNLPVRGYYIRYTTFSVNSLNGDTTAWWNRAAQIEQSYAEDPGRREVFIPPLIFTPGQTYFFGIKSYDDAEPPFVSTIDLNTAQGQQASAAPLDLPPAKVRNITGLYSKVGDRYIISIVWDELTPDEKTVDFDGYVVYRTTISPTLPLTDYQKVAITQNNYFTDLIDQNIDNNGIKIYYRITAIDKPPVVLESEPSEVVTIDIRITDNIPPKDPPGVRGILSRDRTRFNLLWEAVTRNADGTVCNDLVEYRIYRANSIKGEFILKGVVPANAQPLSWIEPEDVRDKIYYYYITAKDSAGNEGVRSPIIDTTIDTSIIYTNDDDILTQLSVHKDAADVLYKETNRFGEHIKIEVIRNISEEKGGILKSCSFIAETAVEEKTVSDFFFDKPVRLVIAFGDVKRDDDWEKGWSLDDVSIFWFNGVEWINLGGNVDPYYRTISVDTKRLGKYMVKRTIRPTSFAVAARQPDRIFTPNGDGWNDYFEIRYYNPKDATVVGKIYDIKGMFVTTMKKGDYNSLTWEGTYADGEPAGSGVYIYQIEVTGTENKTLNGTVVIAR